MRIRLAKHVIYLAALTVAGMSAETAEAQTDVNFNVPGPASWNVGSNWTGGFVPEASVNENAIIGNNRSAFVDDAPPVAGSITLNSGTLEIRPGGSLSAAPGTLTSGNLTVGTGAGTANLIIRRGGSLTAQTLATGGAAATQMTLGETGGVGTASLSVTGGALNRVMRIVGPNVSFSSSGALTFGSAGALVPVITGPSHSAINVTGAAALGGALRPEFSGYTPVLGNSWNLVNAGQISGAFALDLSQMPVTPRGTRFNLTQSATTATLRYSNVLVLSVNRATGATQIQNVVGAPISFEGYTVTAPGGNLTGTWNSFQDQALSGWDEADNSNSSRLTEFKRGTPTTVNAGASLNLGSPFVPIVPTSFGQAAPEDLAFQYAVPGVGTLDGIVEFSGRRNNLVLTIDPATGATAIQNESPFFNVSIDAYTITSTSGKLQTGSAWNSLDDQNISAWDEADNVTNFRLTEFNPTGATLLNGGGNVLNLGNAVNVSGGAPALSDLNFEFKLNTGQTLQGIVVLGPLPVVTPQAGDYDGDSDVDGNDFLVWQRALGSNVPPGTGADGSNNGTVDGPDLTVWKNNFGATAVSASEAAVAGVPEPSAMALTIALAGCLILHPRGRGAAAAVQGTR